MSFSDCVIDMLEIGVTCDDRLDYACTAGSYADMLATVRDAIFQGTKSCFVRRLSGLVDGLLHIKGSANTNSRQIDVPIQYLHRSNRKTNVFGQNRAHF